MAEWGFLLVLAGRFSPTFSLTGSLQVQYRSLGSVIITTLHSRVSGTQPLVDSIGPFIQSRLSLLGDIPYR